jgi:cell fate regulator YaaT (PSP1 superfamily)
MGCSTCPAKALLDNTKTTTDIDSGCGKLDSYDWINDLPDSDTSDLIEVRFKNTHKGFFKNEKGIAIQRGDYIAVAADRGHDIGQVTLTGRMAVLQLKKKKPRNAPDKQVYRKATKADIEKWQMARLKEKPALIKSRQIAERLGLEMKISDVEYQGDGTKATFYYIANSRVDFRELIKHYAREFGVKIEMRQIGARQEAAMVGGIGSCGKELCCSTWRTNLTTVSTNAAKIQALPHNAQKLTGQCSKLKCCLMYELDTYLEAHEDFPDVLLELEVDKGMAYPQKKDLLKRIIYYSYEEKNPGKLHAVDLDRVKEIIQLNKKGIQPELIPGNLTVQEKELSFMSAETDLNRMDKKQDKKRPRNKKNNKNKNQRKKYWKKKPSQ